MYPHKDALSEMGKIVFLTETPTSVIYRQFLGYLVVASFVLENITWSYIP